MSSHRAERLDCDSHACRYHTFPSPIISLSSEQTVDAYLKWISGTFWPERPDNP
ncbi:unnamed protein product [Protopolystoma xenopodis]|uniref:Uncharacterized protein n=1 Tax=Protopolystoma xenopodis TaxID=117903 RepID=A0A448WWS0_9PLAT|nr:unnamed protein product [Protopolystoma xenopodis]